MDVSFERLNQRFVTSRIFSLFWDLYSAAPEKREKADPTLEAKAFVDLVCFFEIIRRMGRLESFYSSAIDNALAIPKKKAKNRNLVFCRGWGFFGAK